MRKRIIVSLFIALVVTFISATAAHAATPQKAVLGAQTSQFSMNPTVEGPGLITPDSLLYPVDLLKQQVRLFFAFTPAQKAAVAASIADERFAEVRVETLKNNREATFTALRSLRDNTVLAGKELASAKDSGMDVKDLARDINNAIKRHQQGLLDLEGQATGEFKQELAVAQATLSDAKHSVENGLSQDELANAVQDDLVWDAERFAQDTADSAQQLRNSLTILQEQAKDAADNNQKVRQQAIAVAIKQKNDQVKKLEEDTLKNDMQKADLARALQADAAATAEDIVKKAQSVATTVSVSQKIANGSEAVAQNPVLGATTKLATPTPIQK